MGVLAKEVFTITRFSVIGSSWRMAERDAEEYRAMLFSRDRLEARLEIFNKITYSSISSLTPVDNVNVKHVILYSSQMPSSVEDALLSTVGRNPSFIMLPVKEGGDWADMLGRTVNSLVSQDSCYATVRLDDDDGLAESYLEQLSPYLFPCYSGMAVSFPRGFAGIYARSKIEKVYNYYEPKLALGLAYINVRNAGVFHHRPTHVHALGNHRKIDLKIPVILDGRQPAYLWTIHDQTDRDTAKLMKRISKLDSATIASLKRAFPTGHFQ